MTQDPFRVFVGWDSREDIAYQVCRHSILARASRPVEIVALRQHELRERGLYWRAADPLASTEFTYTRFLVPCLADYEGWALFCDCDFLWLADVHELAALIDDRYAVMCVHHDHRPPETEKMDGRIQTLYERKNWSSMVLYNCGHPANRRLTPEVVNNETGKFLHRFQWLDDALIGAVNETWNWLEGWCTPPSEGHPKVVHYTRGGPWFDNWQHVAYGELWLAEKSAWEASGGEEMWSVIEAWTESGAEGAEALIAERFPLLVGRAVSSELDHWRETPHGSLALVLLLNAGKARDRAAAVARRSAEAGFAERLAPRERDALLGPLGKEDRGSGTVAAPSSA